MTKNAVLNPWWLHSLPFYYIALLWLVKRALRIRIRTHNHDCVILRAIGLSVKKAKLSVHYKTYIKTLMIYRCSEGAFKPHFSCPLTMAAQNPNKAL